MLICLALYYVANTHALERPVKHYKEKLEEYAGESFIDGVELGMLSTVETCFKIAINVYSLRED